MKRIILSPEDKTRIEARANSTSVYKTPPTKIWRTCPKCRTGYSKIVARENHHVGYCSVECNPGRIPIFRKSRLERKAKKKERLLRKKRTNRAVNKTDFYLSQEWRELRFKVLRMYGATCMLCFRPAKPGFPMHVDHIKPRSKFPELQLSFDNLQVLCEDCNVGKLNHTNDDFRPSGDAFDLVGDKNPLKWMKGN